MKLKDVNFFDITKSISLIVIIIFVVFYGARFIDSYSKSMVNTQQQIIEISKNVVESANNAASDAKVKDLMATFKKEKSEILEAYEAQKRVTGETLQELGHIKAELEKTRKLRVSSDKIYKKESQDPKHWYFFKKIVITNDDGEDIPVAWAMFYPYRDSDKQWKIGTYDLNVDVKVIETENKDGTFNRYGEASILNKDGTVVEKFDDISIDWAKVRQREKRFFLNPRFAIGSVFNTEPGFALNGSVFSYGKTKRDMDWRFLTLGMAIEDQDFYATLEPVSWNIGNVIPGVENIFIGPTVSYDFMADFKYSLQVSVPF
jgi:hypothetical protein